MNTLNEMNYIPSDGDADSLMGRFHSIVERNILRHVKNGFYPDWIAAYTLKTGCSKDEILDVPLYVIADEMCVQYGEEPGDAHFEPVKRNDAFREMTVGEWIESFIKKQIVEEIDNEPLNDWLHLLSEENPEAFRGLVIKLNIRLGGCMLGDRVFGTLRSFGYQAIYEYLGKKAFPDSV